MKRPSPKEVLRNKRMLLAAVAVAVALGVGVFILPRWLCAIRELAVPCVAPPNASPTPSISILPPGQPSIPSTPAEAPSIITSPTAIISPDLSAVSAATTSFANFVDPKIGSFTPAVPTYPVSADLSNVVRADDKEMALSSAAKKLVVKNGFVVVPGSAYEFYPLYEQDRYAQIPFFVTVDSLAHTYHLMFDAVLKRIEEKQLSHSLVTLTDQMLAASQAQYGTVKGTAWEEAARENVGFFAVAKKLNDASYDPPDMVRDDVAKEIALITAHERRTESPLIKGLQEDYSQYVPRGHYTTSEQLKTYFKMMMWYGRIGFTVGADYPDTVRSATLMTLALRDPDLRARWSQISDPIGFIVGQSDDVTWSQFDAVLSKAFGPEASVSSIVADANALTKITSNTQSLPEPKINSGHINADTVTRQVEFRFMGQRFTADANIFQQLVTNYVKGRELPKALDICAAYGSTEAYDLVTAAEPQFVAAYAKHMSEARKELAAQSLSEKTSTLYGSWLYALQPLTSPASSGYPAFMRNQAWVRRDLMDYLGSYTELKHDTVLYTKQAYAAEMGGPGDEEQIPQKDDRGYVEPRPDVYARFAALSDMTIAGLTSRGLLDDVLSQDLSRLSQLSTMLSGISVKELSAQRLSSEDYDLIRGYGGDLEHIWEGSFTGEGQTSLDTPSALVTDVATSPDAGQVLEEGTGYVASIYVIVPIDGKPHLTRGAVFTQYEFPHTWSDRLTDEQWRDMLYKGTNPPLADWTHAFVSP